MGRRRPLILGREGASAAKDRGEKTLADILNQDDDSFGGTGDDLESVKGDTWVMGVGEGRSDEANLSGYFRFSEGDEEDSPWKTEGLLDLSPYQIRAVLVGEPMSVSLKQSTSSVDEGEQGKVKSLYDVVFGESGVDKASGMALPASRGSSIDVGVLHGPGGDSRKRCSIEFWFYLPPADGMTKDIVLARRTMGSAADDLTQVGMAANQACVLWELLLRNTGELEFRTCGGTSLLSTQKKTDSDDEDEEKDKARSNLAVFERWNHVCIVLSSKNLPISKCAVSLYMKGVEIVSDITSVLPSGLTESDLRSDTKLNELLRKSYLLFGLNHTPGYRMTELRVWACERSADDTSSFLYEYLTAAEQKKKFKVKIAHKSKKGAMGKGVGFGPPNSGSNAQSRTMTAKLSLKDTGISLAPQFSLAPPAPIVQNTPKKGFSPESTRSAGLEVTPFEATFADFGVSASTFATPSAGINHEPLPVVKEDANEEEGKELGDKEDTGIEGEREGEDEDVAGTLWDTAMPLSQQIRASAAAALIRGPPATRHYGGNRGGLPDYSGVDRFGVGGIAICGSEKTIVFRDNEDPPALTYPIGRDRFRPCLASSDCELKFISLIYRRRQWSSCQRSNG